MSTPSATTGGSPKGTTSGRGGPVRDNPFGSVPETGVRPLRLLTVLGSFCVLFLPCPPGRPRRLDSRTTDSPDPDPDSDAERSSPTRSTLALEDPGEVVRNRPGLRDSVKTVRNASLPGRVPLPSLRVRRSEVKVPAVEVKVPAVQGSRPHRNGNLRPLGSFGDVEGSTPVVRGRGRLGRGAWDVPIRPKGPPFRNPVRR